MRWTVALMLVATFVSAAYARHHEITGPVGTSSYYPNITGIVGAVNNTPLTPCGDFQMDFSVTTGCNMTAYEIGMR
jgi:hypothetical protein